MLRLVIILKAANDIHLCIYTDTDKIKIIDIFNERIRGRKPDTRLDNPRHCGKDGHWLESQFDIRRNCKNDADLLGFELKKDAAKITFGDWSANEYIYQTQPLMTRNLFLKTFGKPNAKKNGRHSWSGCCCPKIHDYNEFGQILVVDSTGNVFVQYSYHKDKRDNKSSIVPKEFQNGVVTLAKWHAKELQKRVENKFNNKGWFRCCRDKTGAFSHIQFGHPINFATFIKHVRNGTIIFDSGMYEGNARNYSMWRAHHGFWDKLVCQ